MHRFLQKRVRRGMDPNRAWWIDQRAKRTVEKLESHGFKALFAGTKEDAVREILTQIPPERSIGVGGSVTIRSLGVLERLEKQGNRILDHWKPGLSGEEVLDVRKSQLLCDIFLSSVNAVTVNGELINIDGIGNRVNAASFGPGKVILVAGYQKIVEDIQGGLHRIKNVAAPLNARRLSVDVPCARVGRCVDCNSPNRVCRVIVIHERKPLLTEVLVILVGEELGF
jgi:hypothetical protein